MYMHFKHTTRHSIMLRRSVFAEYEYSFINLMFIGPCIIVIVEE